MGKVYFFFVGFCFIVFFFGHAKQLSDSKWAFWPRASSVRLDSLCFPQVVYLQYNRQKIDQHRIVLCP